MTPQLLAIILSLIEEAIGQAPALVADIKAIFAKENPTPADWEALRAKVHAKGYLDYVPDSAIPAAAPANVIPLAQVAPVPPTANPPATAATAAPIPATAPVPAGAPAAPAPAVPNAAPATAAPAAAGSVATAYLPDGSHNPAFKA